MAQKLEIQDFIQIIKNTPLIAIDLILENENKEILVGYRKNNPAKNYWFVPGGRIFKNESFEKALIRILKEETGIKHFEANYTIYNVFDHMYDTCFLHDNPSYTSTHYVVISVKMTVLKDSFCLEHGKDQHSIMNWMSISDILARKDVHPYTQQYFKKSSLQGKVMF